MIKLPLTEIYTKIREKSGLSDEDITLRINTKLQQLSGLISKEGAAHIVANELGIKLFDAVSGRLQIQHILDGMRSVETVGRVKQLYEFKEFQTEKRSGKVGSFILGDETGNIRIVCWGEIAENLKRMKEHDVIKIKGGYVRSNQGRKEVHLNERSALIINPSDENIPVSGAIRKDIKSLGEHDSQVEVIATLIQLFPPIFFDVCPQCKRKVIPQQEQVLCATHGLVQPQHSFAIHAVIDDGTDDMRVTFFQQSAMQLLQKPHETITLLKDNPALFDAEKSAIVGKLVKVTGRMSKNKLSERLEMIANTVDLNPDPNDSLRKLQESVEKAKNDS